jgi:hypothetical protein
VLRVPAPNLINRWRKQSSDVNFRSKTIFVFTFGTEISTLIVVTVETFRQELKEALRAYDKYVICIDKTPEEFEASLISLVNKAIKAYESRGPHLRHGIALDRQVTVILSQNETPRPLCGIYFNLHSPYQRTAPAKAAKPVTPAKSEG